MIVYFYGAAFFHNFGKNVQQSLLKFVSVYNVAR